MWLSATVEPVYSMDRGHTYRIYLDQALPVCIFSWSRPTLSSWGRRHIVKEKSTIVLQSQIQDLDGPQTMSVMHYRSILHGCGVSQLARHSCLVPSRF